MKTNNGKILLVGYGNPGRTDDGLGPRLADYIENLGIKGVDTDSDYQLTVEHAHDISGYKTVIFADADTSCRPPFYLKQLEPGRATVSFSSHSVSPGCVLALQKELFGTVTESWLLGIRGYDFDEFCEHLTEKAQTNLAAAASHLENCLSDGVITEFHPTEKLGVM